MDQWRERRKEIRKGEESREGKSFWGTKLGEEEEGRRMNGREVESEGRGERKGTN